MISRTADLASVGAQEVQKPSSIESWLSLFARLLRLPDANKKAIVDELDQHLRERVRDLMLGGKSETDALRLAIDELGGAAELAEPRLRRQRVGQVGHVRNPGHRPIQAPPPEPRHRPRFEAGLLST